jgi:transcriptional repressor NrdR
MVKKSDGTFQPFNRDKLFAGIVTATKKRPVGLEAINDIVDSIENQFANQMQGQVTSSEIGDAVLNSLKSIDTVAYVRFASVYKDFADTNQFVQIISELEK